MNKMSHNLSFFDTCVEFIKARQTVYRKFEEWGVGGVFPFNLQLLADLLGHNTFEELAVSADEDDLHTTKLLAGPNGYTIYKMLLAKRAKAGSNKPVEKR